ncbi:MAG: hypothetical protein R2729_23525 [Bryobacteraceae bacterium]
MNKFMLQAVVAIALVGALPARADLAAVGDPIPSNSWLQQWSLFTGLLSGGGSFNTIVATMVSPDVDLILSGLAPVGWTESVNGTGTVYTLTKNSAPSTSSLNFFLHYGNDGEVPPAPPSLSPGDKPIVFNLRVFDDATPVASYHLRWHNDVLPNHWTVPEGSSLPVQLSWMVGLLFLVAQRRSLRPVE